MMANNVLDSEAVSLSSRVKQKINFHLTHEYTSRDKFSSSCFF